MKVKFDRLFRGYLLLLLLTTAWGLWAGTESTTNHSVLLSTNLPSVLGRDLERLEEHYLTFGLDGIPLLREHSFLGEPVWKYLASLVYILLAFYAAKLLDWITRAWLQRLAARTETKVDDLLLDLLRGPVKIVVFVVLLSIGLNFFEWSEKVKVLLFKGLVLVVAGSLSYLAVRISNLLLELWRTRTAPETNRKFNDQLFSVLRKSLTGFIVVVAVLVTAQNIGVNITAAITSLSIGGLAVGLAAQDTLANLFGAVSVLADKPFLVGDQIKLEAGEGVVEAIGLRSTLVRNPEGHVISIPNKIMGSAAITNVTRRSNIRTVLNLELAQSLTTAKVKRALVLIEEAYRSHPNTQKVWVSFNQFAGANLNILITHWWQGTDYPQYLAGLQEMNLAVKERFEAEGITFPSPE